MKIIYISSFCPSPLSSLHLFIQLFLSHLPNSIPLFIIITRLYFILLFYYHTTASAFPPETNFHSAQTSNSKAEQQKTTKTTENRKKTNIQKELNLLSKYHSWWFLFFLFFLLICHSLVLFSAFFLCLWHIPIATNIILSLSRRFCHEEIEDEAKEWHTDTN